MSKKVPFASVPKAPVDPMFILKARADGDRDPNKVDLGVGIYRHEQGGCYEFPAIKKAKEILADKDIGHDYNPTTGISSFVQLARQLMFGNSVDSTQIASIQTVAGTGANHIAAAFLSAHYRSKGPNQDDLDRPATAFIGTPGWVNYVPLFAHARLPTQEYRYYDSATRQVDMDSTLHAAQNAPPGSIFVLQGCCHNPTGADMTRQQWSTLANILHERNHLAFFDVAYHGLGTPTPELGGPEDVDVWPVRHFASHGIDLLVCQSFSKNMGLYSERVGVLHVVCREADIAVRVKDVLRSLVRWEFSSAAAYGARLAETILENEELRQQWVREVAAAARRLVSNRQRLHRELTEVLKTPGEWGHLLQGKGLFSLLGLSGDQVERLMEDHHIYLPLDGRINVAGLNEGNVGLVARAIDEVVRGR
ncbi:pyridoxal phosphate-dependent transferase [Aspergillus falconensis]